MKHAHLIDMLQGITFGVEALARLVGERGSFVQENALNAARGINERIRHVVERLSAEDAEAES